MENNMIDTESIGRQIVEYAKIYEGTNKYASVMLAIQFGYELANENNGSDNTPQI